MRRPKAAVKLMIAKPQADTTARNPICFMDFKCIKSDASIR